MTAIRCSGGGGGSGNLVGVAVGAGGGGGAGYIHYDGVTWYTDPITITLTIGDNKCLYCGQKDFKPGLYGMAVCCSCGAPKGECQP